MKALIKPQYVDQIPKAVKGTVQQLLDKKDERKNQADICKRLGMLFVGKILLLDNLFIRNVPRENFFLQINLHICGIIVKIK